MTCTVGVEESVQNEDGTYDERITLAVHGPTEVVEAFEADIANGFRILVYGSYSLYVAPIPTPTPTTAEPTTPAPTTEAEAEFVSDACTLFQSAALDGTSIILTNLEEIPEDMQLCATYVDTSDSESMHTAYGNFDAIKVFGATESSSAAMKQELDDLYFYHVTSLGGVDVLLAGCACSTSAQQAANYSIDDDSYDAETGLFIVFLACFLLVCALLLCCASKNGPTEEESAAARKQLETHNAITVSGEGGDTKMQPFETEAKF